MVYFEHECVVQGRGAGRECTEGFSRASSLRVLQSASIIPQPYSRPPTLSSLKAGCCWLQICVFSPVQSTAGAQEIKVVLNHCMFWGFSPWTSLCGSRVEASSLLKRWVLFCEAQLWLTSQLSRTAHSGLCVASSCRWVGRGSHVAILGLDPPHHLLCGGWELWPQHPMEVGFRSTRGGG